MGHGEEEEVACVTPSAKLEGLGERRRRAVKLAGAVAGDEKEGRRRLAELAGKTRVGKARLGLGLSPLPVLKRRDFTCTREMLSVGLLPSSRM